MNENTKRAIWTPVVLSIVLAAGIYLGAVLLPKQQGVQVNQEGNAKIDALFQLIRHNYVDAVTTDSLEEIAFPVILKELDPHSVYISPEDMKQVSEQMDGNFEGIGVQFNLHNDTVLIVSTISGGPSEKVGLLAGDRIVTINDSLFAGKNISTEEIMKNLKGKKGTKVKVGIKRTGFKELLDFEIIRDKIPLYSVDVSYMVDDEIGYIKINRFAKTTYDEFLKGVKEMLDKGMTKLVLDLRQNGGGLLGVATRIADEFLTDKKMIVYIEGNSRRRQNYIATDEGICEKIEIAVIIDTWSASASEIVAGAIQDNDRGIIVGRRSFGKGLVQEPFTFHNGAVIRLTTARYYTPTGRSIQKSYEKGIEDYFHDIGDRIMRGELTAEDSISFPDSLKFITAGGKTVYGGGGITPDVFVPLDTVAHSDYYNKLFNSGLIYQFALDYADKHRPQLNRFKEAGQIDSYLHKVSAIDEFIRFASQKGVSRKEKSLGEPHKDLTIQLHALIARNILKSKGYYPLVSKIDKDLQRAIEELKK